MKSDKAKPVCGWRASVQYSRWLFAITGGASFACLLVLITLSAPDHLAKIAIICFATALPLIGQHVLVLNDESQGHHRSRLMGVMAGLGLLVFFVGFLAMLARVSTPIAVYWFCISSATIIVLEASQQRAAKMSAK